MNYTDPTPRHPRHINTGKVRIGIAYVPPAKRLNSDEVQIQTALIADHGSRLVGEKKGCGLPYTLFVCACFGVLFFLV